MPILVLQIAFKMKRVLVFAFAVVVVASSQAQVINYTTALSWNTAVDYYQAITFTSLAPNVAVTNQYAGAGVNFQDAVTWGSSDFTDGIGIFNSGGSSPIEIDFTNNTTAFASDLLVGAQYSLYEGSSLIGTSGAFGSNTFAESFGGVTSTVAFDRVIVSNWAVAATPDLDNIYWGAAASAPEPVSMVALGIGAVSLLVRRRNLR